MTRGRKLHAGALRKRTRPRAGQERMKGFFFCSPAAVIFGTGTASSVGVEACRLGCRKPLVLTGSRMASSPCLDGIRGSFEKAGLPFALYDGVIPEPPEGSVCEAADLVRREGFDSIVALGGGSTMDYAKITAVMALHDVRASEMAGNDRVPGRGLPTIMLPTTSGSGSEVSPVAVLSFPGEGMKRGIASRWLIPSSAIVDPALTLGLPPETTANTGVDALIHGIESFLSIKANPLSRNLSLLACRNIASNLLSAVHYGNDLEAREGMSLGSLAAGLAFSMAGTAAVHALAYPLGGQFHVPHGAANAAMLKPVLRFNRALCGEEFANLAREIGVTVSPGADDPAEAFIVFVEELCEKAGVKTRLRDLGIPRQALGIMAEAAMRETRLLENNPRHLDRKDAEEIYSQAW